MLIRKWSFPSLVEKAVPGSGGPRAPACRGRPWGCWNPPSKTELTAVGVETHSLKMWPQTSSAVSAVWSLFRCDSFQMLWSNRILEPYTNTCHPCHIWSCLLDIIFKHTLFFPPYLRLPNFLLFSLKFVMSSGNPCSFHWRWVGTDCAHYYFNMHFLDRRIQNCMSIDFSPFSSIYCWLCCLPVFLLRCLLFLICKAFLKFNINTDIILIHSSIGHWLLDFTYVFFGV